MTEAEDEIYRKLQLHLDKMPVGFPVAENGADIRVLKAFFTPEEANFATFLNFFPSTTKDIWRRVKRKLGMSLEETTDMLEHMKKKGLLYWGENPKTGDQLYLNAPFAIGFYEFALHHLDKERVEAFEAYIDTFIDEFFSTGIPQVRTIPIEAAITPELGVMAYDEVYKLLDRMKEPFAVATCVCTQEREILGKKCTHDLTERCMVNSRWFIKNRNAREITREEARALLKQAQDDGLVIQPGNYKRNDFFCLCCGCCCGILTNVRKLDKPAKFVATNHYSEVDPDTCVACGTCMDRCPMEAITIDDVASINLDRCIGCGVCIPSCPEEAIHLRRKEHIRELPESKMDMFSKMMQKKNEIRKVAN